MENISSELEKLISYTLGRDVVTEEDVEALAEGAKQGLETLARGA